MPPFTGVILTQASGKWTLTHPLLVRLRGKIWPCVIRDFLRFWLPFLLAYYKCGAADQGRDFFWEQKERGREGQHTYKSVPPQQGERILLSESRSPSLCHTGSLSVPAYFFFLLFVTISSYFIKSHAFIQSHVFVMSPPLNRLLSN